MLTHIHIRAQLGWRDADAQRACVCVRVEGGWVGGVFWGKTHNFIPDALMLELGESVIPFSRPLMCLYSIMSCHVKMMSHLDAFMLSSPKGREDQLW